MIKSTFTFIPGIGENTEKQLWDRGVITWNDLFGDKYFRNLLPSDKSSIKSLLEDANTALGSDISFFVNKLPSSEYWRLYKSFHEKVLYLDIETTGLSRYYHDVTVVGTFDGFNFRIFVKDVNLDDLSGHLKNYDILVTFNGKKFDVPFLEKYFQDSKTNVDFTVPPIHIDLRYLLRSLGYKGSLKNIEKQLCINRDISVTDLDGREATVLWSKFLRGDVESLQKLLLYNVYDVINLKKIMDFCYHEKCKCLKETSKSKSRQTWLFHENASSLDYELSSSIFKTPSVNVQNINDVFYVWLNEELALTIDLNNIKKVNLKLNELVQKILNNGYEPVSVGIDLTGSEKRATGFCVLKGSSAYLSLVKTDDELISLTEKANPAVVSIDSPLGLPGGVTLSEGEFDDKKYGIMRICEKILKKRSVNVYPCWIQSMRGLTQRGMRLANIFRYKGYLTIESFPGAAQDILQFPRKKVDLKELEISLKDIGIEVKTKKENISHDELDALTSALVGYFYLADMYEAIGVENEGLLIVPDVKRD